ncbi:MAG: hypothetical protein K0R14_239 [Burkholderiales bacterium]|jgi:hypothetical protein|nr:hypothetical protein [Burkholderiales bacterium]
MVLEDKSMSNELVLITPDLFNSKEVAFFESKKQIIREMNILNPGMICGIKDTNSIHHISTDAYANVVGLKNGIDVIGKSDFDMPCDGTVRCAHSYVYWDKESMLSGKVVRTSDCNLYATGLGLQIYTKTPIILDTRVLGICYFAERQETLPSQAQHILKIIGNNCFNIVGIEHIFQDNSGAIYKFDNDLQLEICFYVMLSYSDKDIASLYNQISPTKISHIRRHICEKYLNLDGSMRELMQSKLESIGFTRIIPSSIYQHYFAESSLVT